MAMQITIEPSADMISIDGSPCRIWTGTDQDGTEITVLVRAVQPLTHDKNKLAAFEQELQALPPLQPVAIDYRFFID